jgi:hypothetical protein
MIKEFPPSTIRLLCKNIPIAGRGYLRLFPFRFIKWAIRWTNEVKKQPVVIYLHPRELDPEQPRLKAGLITNFRQYINLDKTEIKFKKLLRDFNFGFIKEVMQKEK